jgi:hypothetical protein
MNKFYTLLLIIMTSCGTATMNHELVPIPNDSVYYEESIHILIDSNQNMKIEDVGFIEEKIIKKPTSSKLTNSKFSKDEIIIKRTDSIVRALEKRVIEVKDSLDDYRSLKK